MNPEAIRQQITGLLATCPELAEDDVLRADMIEGETSLHECLRMIERRRQEACSLAGAIAGNIAELSERQERFERREQAMRALMFKLLQAGELKKVELPEATLSVANGKPKVIITDVGLLADRYWRVKREPDMRLIAETIKDRPVEGATLSNAEPHLTIRTR